MTNILEARFKKYLQDKKYQIKSVEMSDAHPLGTFVEQTDGVLVKALTPQGNRITFELVNHIMDEDSIFEREDSVYMVYSTPSWAEERDYEQLWTAEWELPLDF